MYTKQEASLARQRFWTSFGQYMRPVRGATGDTINWVNYKTGIRHIYFRMDVTRTEASIAIELQHPDAAARQLYWEQLLSLRVLLEKETGESWDWDFVYTDEQEQEISRIGTVLQPVNIFEERDWPSIISFLKPRIIALDGFWSQVRDAFE